MKIFLVKKKLNFFSAPGKRFPGNLFLGAGSGEVPPTGKFPGNLFVGRGYTVPRSVSMPLIQPDFGFKSHPQKNSQGIFLWVGGLRGPNPEMVKKQIQFFPSP